MDIQSTNQSGTQPLMAALVAIFRIMCNNLMKMLDSLDKELIELLGKDARQSSKVLAKRLNRSSATIRRRLRKLTQAGVLRIVGVVDPTRAGLPLTAVITYNVAPDKLELFIDMLINRPEIKWVSTATGRFGIIAMARFASTDELSNFLQQDLAHAEGLKDSETFICLQVKKGHYVPFC